MSAKTENALKTILLALVTAPAGEMTEAQLEGLKGVGIPQLKALKDRGILAKEYRGANGEVVGLFEAGTWIYFAA